MEEARAEQRDLRWKILGSGGVALIGALFFSLLLSHGLSVPIRELVAGTGEIERGNFGVKVPVRGRDEIGRLATSFNEMADGLAQKERYRTVLNQVADENVAQKLISGEITLGGELRDVSVLFCDIRGFTPLTQNMPPGEVIEMLNEHMTALTHVVKEHNGVLDKFVGDLLMAIFGAPVPRGDYTANAARCALRLIEERNRLNQTSRHNLQIGIGLATGNVVAGGMGSSDRFHYTVLGERVNLGSRLCSQAAGGEVLIDQNTKDRLGGSAIVETAAVMKLKGFSEPVQAYKLVAIRGEHASA
jgi:class 3 adenylate cyclase